MGRGVVVALGRRVIAAGMLVGLAAVPALAQDGTADGGEKTTQPPAIREKVKGMARREGLLPFYVDRDAGKIWLELPPEVEKAKGVSFIYDSGLRQGLGSNPVGLDRDMLGDTRVVTFRRVGEKVLLEQPNLAYRADAKSAAEKTAVRESFASSVLWAAKIAARDGDGRLLVDLTPFLTRDAMNVAATLEQTDQGDFTLDADRSAVDLDQALAFPDNVEFDAVLTFSGKKPGAYVRQTVPTPEAVTLVEHHSFVRLPDDGYRRRVFDPRAGSFDMSYLDYASPLDAPLEKKWITRHRLEKLDPTAARSRVKKPIVYYVDPGIPEPVRSAIIEGASWWSKAFEAAGFIDAFKVEVLPEGVDPLDVRYNVIHWVHRSTRGWSWGHGLIDPRTGEILKGNVRLGSLRIRQDRLLFEGLAGTAKTGTGSPDDPVVLALARIRQLAAHEVGHTLGLTHNFAASTYGRASVMDYPAPLVKVKADGTLDFSSAYAVGVGAWDIFAIKYAYTEFPPGTDEKAALESMVQDAIRHGLVFITDDDARPDGAAEPLGNLWDNGSNPVDGLEQVLKVRRIALNRFGADAVRMGRPLALLQETFLPVYFHHRYQLAAAAKEIAGLQYAYAVRGDGQPPAAMIDPAEQRRALSVILKVLDPAELDIPDRISDLILPRPFGYETSVETLQNRTAPAFDPLGAAATAAAAVVAAVLQPERAARLVDFHHRDPDEPGLAEVVRSVVDKGFELPAGEPARYVALHGLVRRTVVDGILSLASDDRSSALVRAGAEQALRDLAARLRSEKIAPAMLAAEDMTLGEDISRFLDRRQRDLPAPAKPVDMPPGDPIGSAYPELGHLAGCSWGDGGE